MVYPGTRLCVGGKLDERRRTGRSKSLGFGQFGGLYTPYENFLNDWGDRPLIRTFAPYPQFRKIFNPFDTTGADKYDGLQVSVQKRTGSGLTLLLAYTLSKTFSNTDSTFSEFEHPGTKSVQPRGRVVRRQRRSHSRIEYQPGL